MDIGVFFANHGRQPSQQGALFVLDATETGKVQQKKTVEEILRIVEAKLYEQPFARPLLFLPPKQIRMERAKRQEAQYFAQMDLRFDLQAIWRMLEQDLRRRVLLKIILPAGSNKSISDYLQNKGLTEQFVMADDLQNS